MQVIPALPWDKGAGGQIKFADPITIEDLLVGKVKISLDYNGEVADNVRFYRAPGTDTVTVMSGGSTIFGVSLNSNTLSLNYIYQDDSYNLESVELVEIPAISTYPSLPWATTLNEGVIKLESPITFEEIIGGTLAFLSTDNSWLEIEESANYAEITLPGEGVVYKIARFDGSKSVITLQRDSDAPNIGLKAVVQNYGELSVDIYFLGENGEAPVNGEIAYPVVDLTGNDDVCALTQDGISVLRGIFDNTAGDCVDLSFEGSLSVNTIFNSGNKENFMGGRLIKTELVNESGTIRLHIVYPEILGTPYYSLNSAGASSPVSLYSA